MVRTFTASWRLPSTDSTSIRLSQLKEVLENSLNSLVGTEQADQLLSALRGRELTGRLFFSVTNKGFLHVTYTEKPTLS